MESEALACFPDGIRALLVDDDPQFLKTAGVMLSLCNYKVTTCSSPHSAMKVLSGEGEFDVLLSDAHKVGSCGFDFRTIVEADLRIPVVYCVSFDTGEPDDAVINTLQAASYMIRKPLHGEDVKNLWRVVAWHKCCLETKASAQVVARDNGSSSDNAETRVYFKEVRASKTKKGKEEASSESKNCRVLWTPTLREKFESAVQRLGREAAPSQILKDMNVEGLRRGHVASRLQKYRARVLKENGNVWPPEGFEPKLRKQPLFTGAESSSYAKASRVFPMQPSEHQTGQASNNISQGATSEQIFDEPISPPLNSMASTDGAASEMVQCGIQSTLLGDSSSLAAQDFRGEEAKQDEPVIGASESEEFHSEALFGLDFLANGPSGDDRADGSSLDSEKRS